MSIKFQFSQLEIDELNKARSESRQTLANLADTTSDTRRYLGEMHVSDAEVSLMRNSKGNISWGSTRVPLLVKTQDDFFVLKPYENKDKGRERKILERVEGKIAPNVRHFGGDFYTEDLVDHNGADNLELIADQGEEGLLKAVRIGAGMHAKLAKMRINYAHNHWLDEFNLVNGKPMITDFGASHFFIEEGEIESIDGRMAHIKREGVSDFFDIYAPIPCFHIGREDFKNTRSKLLTLTDNPTELVNLLYVLRQGINGVKTYVERIPARVEAGFAIYEVSDGWVSGWDKAMEVFPGFVDAFDEEYKKAS